MFPLFRIHPSRLFTTKIPISNPASFQFTLLWKIINHNHNMHIVTWSDKSRHIWLPGHVARFSLLNATPRLNWACRLQILRSLNLYNNSPLSHLKFHFPHMCIMIAIFTWSPCNLPQSSSLNACTFSPLGTSSPLFFTRGTWTWPLLLDIMSSTTFS